jgi:hypothetical protein
MPDPITSSSFSPDPTCNLGDDPSLTCQSPAAAPAATDNACLPPQALAEPTTTSSTSALVQKFARSEPTTFIAVAPSASPGAAAPGVLTVRPDQVDLQTGIPRIQAHATLGSVQLTGGLDILNVNAHLGSLNDDGSRGENIGVGANLLGGELNIDYHGWSLTVGVAASLGVSISSGDGRDIDGDGVRERCFAMSLGPFTLGECDEL